MNNKNKKTITGIHITNLDVVEAYYIAKAAKEKKLGRILTEDETNDLFADIRKTENVNTIWVEKDPKDVRAIITEHFDVKVIKPKKKSEE